MQIDGTSATHRHLVTLCLSVLHSVSVVARIQVYTAVLAELWVDSAGRTRGGAP